MAQFPCSQVCAWRVRTCIVRAACLPEDFSPPRKHLSSTHTHRRVHTNTHTHARMNMLHTRECPCPEYDDAQTLCHTQTDNKNMCNAQTGSAKQLQRALVLHTRRAHPGRDVPLPAACVKVCQHDYQPQNQDSRMCARMKTHMHAHAQTRKKNTQTPRITKEKWRTAGKDELMGDSCLLKDFDLYNAVSHMLFACLCPRCRTAFQMKNRPFLPVDLQ